MALMHAYKFTRTVIDWNVMAEAFKNRFRVIAVSDYTDKNGVLPNGKKLVLAVLHDDFDYGTDKKGNPLDNNEGITFDVTVLCSDKAVKKNDVISLKGFDADHSYFVDFNLILRFRDFEVLQPKKPTM